MERGNGLRQDAVVKRRRYSPETRRDEILHAAIALFASHGFTRTTTKEIAHAANIAEGTIYKYFTSKEELLFAFLQPLMSISLTGDFPVNAEPDDAAIIRSFLNERFAVWQRNRDLMKVIISEALFNQELSDGLTALLMPAIAHLAQYLAARMAAGAFMEIDPVVAARGLLGQAFAHFLQCSLLHLTPGGEDCWHEVSETLTMLFLKGIVVRGTAGQSALRPEGRE